MIRIERDPIPETRELADDIGQTLVRLLCVGHHEQPDIIARLDQIESKLDRISEGLQTRRTTSGPGFIRRTEVEHRTGLSRASIYVLMDKGEFPRAIKVTDRAVRWVESEIDDWIAARIAKRDAG